MADLSREELIPARLPPGARIAEEGRAIGRRLRPGRTLFLRRHGVGSEAEYKRRMRARGEVMFHAQYGLSSWAASAEGLRHIHEELGRRAARLDRFGLCLDRAMGLPPEARGSASPESGLKLTSEEEWRAHGRRLRRAMSGAGVPAPVFVGGRLNQDTGEALPVGVEAELLALGITPARDPLEVIERLGRGSRT
jgi:hypothetical protein